MTVRRASLVCCLALLAIGRAASADGAHKDAASGEAGQSGDVDEMGRSKWWPSPPAGHPDRTSPLASEGPEEKTRMLQPYQRGLLFMPYMAMSIPVGSHSGSYATGHGVGVLLGPRLTARFSLNLEVSVDFMSPGPAATETQTDFALSPLWTSGDARRLWMFGFKLGVSNFTRSTGPNSSGDESYSATGLTWGGTIGGFVPVGPVAIGCLVRLTFRHLSGNCDEDEEGTICNPDAGTRSRGISPALGTFDIAAAALF